MATISVEHLYKNGKDDAKVGAPATILMYSDSHAATVVKRTKSTVTVQRDKAIVVPESREHWPDVEYTYEPNPEAGLEVFRWSPMKGWISKGRRLLVGVRREYRDPTF